MPKKYPGRSRNNSAWLSRRATGRAEKMRQAARILARNPEIPLVDLAELLGYRSVGSFSTAFKAVNGQGFRDMKRRETKVVFRPSELPRTYLELTMLLGQTVRSHSGHREGVIIGVRHTKAATYNQVTQEAVQSDGLWLAVKPMGTVAVQVDVKDFDNYYLR